jgi:hypothetical protein
VIPLYVDLQLDATRHVDELLSLGVPDRARLRRGFPATAPTLMRSGSLNRWTMATFMTVTCWRATAGSRS